MTKQLSSACALFDGTHAGRLLVAAGQTIVLPERKGRVIMQRMGPVLGDAQCMKETAGNRWCSTCRLRPPVKKLPTTPPQFADVKT